MPPTNELLFATWRLVGRHRTLSEVMANLLTVVGSTIPTELVVVRRIDLKRGCLETVAVAAGRDVVPPRHAVEQLSYTDRHVIRQGGREIELVHVDRAVTPGDTMIVLPRERIVLAGDVLVNPISFALSVYPDGWINTLEWLDAFDAAVIVPGHGDPMRDETKLKATLEIFRMLRAHGAAAKAKGLDAWAASDEAYALVRDPMVVLTGDAPQANQAFRAQLVEWFMHRVYDELYGPLSDTIAPIPSR